MSEFTTPCPKLKQFVSDPNVFPKIQPTDLLQQHQILKSSEEDRNRNVEYLGVDIVLHKIPERLGVEFVTHNLSLELPGLASGTARSRSWY